MIRKLFSIPNAIIFFGILAFVFVAFAYTALAVDVPTNVADAEIQAEGGSFYSGIVNCGKSGDRDSNTEAQPCTACHAILAGKNLLDYLMRIMVVVAIAVTFAMGIFYILSGVNADLKKKAKEGLTAVVTGIVFMLSAWLIVSAILFYIADDGFVNGDANFVGLVKGEGMFGISCSTQSSGGRGQLNSSGVIYGNGSAGTSVSQGAGTGSCSPIQNAGNPCSVANLTAHPCWGPLGETVIRQASGICNAESGGISSIRTNTSSATDHCGSARAPVVSQGLFQVNTTAHYSAIGCPKIANPGLTNTQEHSDGWYDASCRIIVSDSVLNVCFQKAIDPAWNINYACRLYKERGNWGAWNYSYTNKCNSFR
jgi:hypothetical protein